MSQIAFDATSYATGTSSPVNITHTNTGLNRILIVFIYLKNALNNPTVTGVTYNGVAMTQAALRTSANDAHYSYVLVNPTSGANTVAVSFTQNAGTTTAYCYALSYTGARQNSQPDASTQGNNGGTSNTLTTTITTVTNNCWVIGFSPNYAQSATSSSSGITNRNSSNNWILAGDSNSNVSPAGNYSMTHTVSGTADVYWNMVSLAPATEAAFLFNIT